MVDFACSCHHVNGMVGSFCPFLSLLGYACSKGVHTTVLQEELSNRPSRMVELQDRGYYTKVES